MWIISVYYDSYFITAFTHRIRNRFKSNASENYTSCSMRAGRCKNILLKACMVSSVAFSNKASCSLTVSRLDSALGVPLIGFGLIVMCTSSRFSAEESQRHSSPSLGDMFNFKHWIEVTFGGGCNCLWCKPVPISEFSGLAAMIEASFDVSISTDLTWVENMIYKTEIACFNS